MAHQVKLKYLHISPRKVRLVADAIRGKKVDEAQSILSFTVKKASLPVLKLLNSAVANVKEKTDKLYISKITVDEGPVMKRVFPRAKGRGDVLKKRSSHVTLVLDEIKENKKKKK
ncbi:MAG: 50S ribosomal protein L22 [Candidatus Microsyncoccus archaeolyticus]|jgi:large subunit ribosomal protein L22|nr:MAG: 50S ribosomal protein L22 [Candidatus Parcubacteria bacterium]